jgi:hypothetical protein
MTLSCRIAIFTFLATFLSGAGAANAQAIGPMEAVTPNGGVSQDFALSPAQRSAIYNAVLGQRVRGLNPRIVTAIGAPVPPSVTLQNLPEQVAVGDQTEELLKYALVENNVIVVDPIRMRVVDVIPGPGL